MDQDGPFFCPFWPDEVHFGPFGSTNRTPARESQKKKKTESPKKHQKQNTGTDKSQSGNPPFEPRVYWPLVYSNSDGSELNHQKRSKMVKNGQDNLSSWVRALFICFRPMTLELSTTFLTRAMGTPSSQISRGTQHI